MSVDLATVRIAKGSHGSPDDGACVMEWVSLFAGLPFGDSPQCTDPVVAAYARALNDVMPDAQRQRLIPFIPRLADSPNGCPPEKRALLCADVAVRVFAVAALRAAGLSEQADRLAGLAPVVGRDSASAAANAAAAARDAAGDAAMAAGDARDAAWAAAWAAWDAARAARDAASAAGDAAMAAGDAAMAAGASIWDEAISLLDRLIDMREETP